MMTDKPGCPRCGGRLFLATIQGVQYYTASGEPSGYEIMDGTESKTVRCYDCGYRTTVEKLKERNKGHE